MNIFMANGRYLVSLLPHQHVFRHGLPAQAILGECADDGTGRASLQPGDFRPNRGFIDCMHEVIAAEAPELKTHSDRARAVHEGRLLILDQRATAEPHDREDVIGEFKVQAGLIVPGSYLPNPSHVLLSHHGWFKLDDELETRLVQSLMKLSPERRPGLYVRIRRWLRGGPW